MRERTNHKPYPREFREQVVKLAPASRRSVKGVAGEFEISSDSLRRGARQAERDQGLRKDGLITSERQELARLRRENRQLRMERQILSKAAVWFARETEAIPSGSSHS